MVDMTWYNQNFNNWQIQDFSNTNFHSIDADSFLEWWKKNNIDIEPNYISWWWIIAKFFIWWVIWWVISWLLFIVLSFVGSMFTDALQQTSFKWNSLLPIILIFIAFLWGFLWNMIVAFVYNLFYNKKYNKLSKSLWMILLSNSLLLIVFLPLYLLFSNQVNVMFFIMAFHIIFSVFVSLNLMDFVSNPNYSASALIWNIFWFWMSVLLYWVVFKIANVSSIQQQTYILICLPPILSFSIIPLFSGIREKIYYKFYEMWNNGFFIPSISISWDSDSLTKNEDDEINVDI